MDASKDRKEERKIMFVKITSLSIHFTWSPFKLRTNIACQSEQNRKKIEMYSADM